MGFRRRDVLMILPFSLIAAAGAAVWLPTAVVLAWLGVNLVIIGLCQLAYAGILAGPREHIPGPVAFAVLTFVTTGIYAVLPLLLVVHGSHAAAVAGLAMMAAMALSATSEFVLSKPVGGAALAGVFAATVVGVVASTRLDSPVQLAVALIGATCFFAYVVGHALHRRKVERDLAEARREAEAHAIEADSANAAKSEFLATMSHEIRTPLNGVIGMAQVMECDTLTPLQRDRLGIVRQSGETLLTLLNDVLDLSKIEAGKLECEWEPFDLGELLRGVGSSYTPLAARKGLRFEVSVAEPAAGVYRGDSARIRQILNNLLSNALKFTEQGEVTLAVARDDGTLVLVVRDTGMGMAADRLHRLFEKFSQLDASTTRRFGGTGLGLAISRQLAELMGGGIAASSELGAGSTFTVTLPLERLGDGRREADASNDPAETAGGFDALRVLAAEDNPVNRLVLKTLLEQVGIEPILVENGEEAVAAWQDGDWDLILMDVQMPVMDGVQATHLIRAQERQGLRARTPIIALTANAMNHQLAEYEAAEMDGCVSKPIRAGELFAAIQAVLNAGPASLEVAV